MTNKSKPAWLKEHFTDPYVKKAKAEGYRSRAAYKLLELQERDHLFKPGMVVIELGAAPGSWTQLITQFVKPHGRVIAVDILPMDPIQGADFIQADFTSDETMKKLQESISSLQVNWVVSDMSPNISGQNSVDIPRSLYLVELALAFAQDVLGQNGNFLTKVFQGSGFDSLLTSIRQSFKKVVIRKPKASRDRSREIYILAQGMKK